MPDKENIEILKPPFKRTAESEQLYAYLIAHAEGQLVSYETVRALINEDPQRGAGYGIVKAVRERLIKEESIVWFVIPSVGIQRATAPEMLEISDGNLQGIKRKIMRTTRITGAAANQYAKLNDEQKTEFNFLMSVTGALKQFFVRSKQKKIRDKIQENQTVIEHGNVLKLFQ